MQEAGLSPSLPPAGPSSKPKKRPEIRASPDAWLGSKSAACDFPSRGSRRGALFGRPDTRTCLGFRGFLLLFLSGRSIHLTACNQPLRIQRTKPSLRPPPPASPESFDPGASLAGRNARTIYTTLRPQGSTYKTIQNKHLTHKSARPDRQIRCGYPLSSATPKTTIPPRRAGNPKQARISKPGKAQNKVGEHPF